MTVRNEEELSRVSGTAAHAIHEGSGFSFGFSVGKIDVAVSCSSKTRNLAVAVDFGEGNAIATATD